jgi:hypothetical protein
MNSLHCSLNILTLTRGLLCYHPHGNTIVITLCNTILVVYVSHTQVMLLFVCAVGSELHSLANIHCVPLWFRVQLHTELFPRHA